MTSTCRKCQRINPSEAAYCYHDGIPLGGHGRGAALPIGDQLFPTPFLFPSGHVCRTFNELSLGCHGDWAVTRELLQQGHLERFLGGIGRIDLAMAAREAARQPDADRGLDDLLGRFPGDALSPAQLVVRTGQVDLGTLAIGSDRGFALTLENGGMRLLTGSVTVEDAPWLSLGDGASSGQKIFQFDAKATFPIQVIGSRLRAGQRLLEGRLVVTSNGGIATVVVSAAVPVKPFPEGALRGATSPRQVAEKAKASPKESAVFFENGAVQRWYADNGWTYPVLGPRVAGLGAVQQFFEALGLTKPPKVAISASSLSLHGKPGDTVGQALRVQTEEKRPVFAFAGCDQTWLRVGKINLDGRVATIPLTVPSIPDRPGETLTARVTVTANGNQRFVVPVTLSVAGGRRSGVQSPTPAVAVAVPRVEAAEAVIDHLPGIAVESPKPIRRPTAVPRVPAVSRSGSPLIHLIPLGVLFLFFFILIVRDLLVNPSGPGTDIEEPTVVEIDPKPQIDPRFHDGPKGTEFDKLLPRATMRFGLVMLNDNDVDGKPKKLTFDEFGRTNNACLRVDGTDALFGDDRAGSWEERAATEWSESDIKHSGMKTIWTLTRSPIRVTQIVEIVPGEIVPVPNSNKLVRYRDTCLVRYTLENTDRKEHEVGLRFLLDTYIGANDGVPFVIPGQAGLCDTKEDFSGKDIPGYIEAQENDDLRNPGTVAHVQFRLGEPFDAPDRVLLGAWPDGALKKELNESHALGPLTRWEVPLLSMKTLPELARKLRLKPVPADSAVTIYWNPKTLQPGGKREVGFAYGLGKVSTQTEGGGNFALTGDSGVVEGREFTLQAVVDKPAAGQTLTLTLPDGLTLASGSEATQKVPPVSKGSTRASSTVTWKIKAVREGIYRLEVKSSAGGAQKRPVRVDKKSGIFGSN